jgi:hypothetical protein
MGQPCEFQVKAPTALAGGGSTMHYSHVLKLPAENAVFSLDSAEGSEGSWSRL